MSALLHPQLRAPVDVAPGSYALKIGTDTHVAIAVEHAGEEQGRTMHTVRVRTEHGDLGVAASLQVLAPCAAYTHPSQEPDDNSVAARMRRAARVQMHADGELSPLQAWTLVYVVFTLWPDQEAFVLARAPGTPAAALLECGLAVPHPDGIQHRDWATHDVIVPRAAFWQGAGPLGAAVWVPALAKGSPYPFLPATYGHAAQGLVSGVQHPLRPLKVGAWDASRESAEPVYRRYIPALKQTLTFRLARSQSDADVDLLHRWHATDRVRTGWRQDLPRAEHQAYLAAQEASSDSVALIGEWDGEPFGYVEIYYAKESNLCGFHDIHDFDRGFHALVGEERFRGPHRVRAWMGSVVHLLFFLDPRTTRVVSEPRASNTKMVEYECLCGGHVEKLIDLPHKRAALVLFPRERFFQLCPLGPLPGQHL
ncbi:hypothetical protein MCAP1_000345 [Malassezia caprae]|uniref:Acyltransferase MbtK/IucB-like conserved domain-containing protein n=1 Tax=Malassezia caprae TaxID=1381934 RepID=A0AAF0E3J2_9BASI|nr:hypothetical protein MCAP1_000345 [Malassezia caprae]